MTQHAHRDTNIWRKPSFCITVKAAVEGRGEYEGNEKRKRWVEKKGRGEAQQIKMLQENIAADSIPFVFHMCTT